MIQKNKLKSKTKEENSDYDDDSEEENQNMFDGYLFVPKMLQSIRLFKGRLQVDVSETNEIETHVG